MTTDFSLPQALSRRGVLAVLGASALAGCSSILPQPVAVQLYVLRPTIMPPAGASVSWRLSVATPDAVASLDTTRIALMRSPTTMDYFAQSAWTDRVPLLVQRLLIQAFENSGRIVSVDRDTTGLEDDYLLETEIRDFQANYDSAMGAPEIVVTLEAKLARMPERSIVASKNATARIMAAQNSVDSVVAAFNQATASALSQIVAWTLAAPAPVPRPAAG
jgi:cholesterol transport system auxiliary component